MVHKWVVSNLGHKIWNIKLPIPFLCVYNSILLHLLFGPELVEQLLDLHTPVVLQAVEGVLWHGGHHGLLDGRQLLQDAGEGGTLMRVLVPAF